jgi:glyceraldehyde-3-phosphate dehydrogenase (NADP+)
MRVYHEEQFGPVVPIASYYNIGDVIKYVVDSNYGQQASVFCIDPKELNRIIQYLLNQVCRVNINCQCQRGPDTYPFTGRKDSAEGTLSITDALKVFSIRTMVAAKDSYTNKKLIEYHRGHQ